MIGFILNDLLSLRSYLLRQIGLILLASIAISIGMCNFAMMPLAVITCFMLTMVSCFTVDECAKWNSFALTLPVERHDIVSAKYVLFLGGLIVSALVSGIVSACFSTLLFQTGSKELLIISGAFCIVLIPMFCIFLPLLIKLGVEKARVCMMLVFLIPFFVFFVAMQSYDFATAVFGGMLPFSLTVGQMVLWAGIALVVLAVCVMVSYRISVKLYAAKEF